MFRSWRCDFKDGRRGESWGQGHFTLRSALAPHVLMALSFMLLVSIGIFDLNSCVFGVKKARTHTIFLLPLDSPDVDFLVHCRVLV